ncbi:MAG: prepilin peptidase [Pseudonocardiaceae bacterium]|nr:prepilin peptidase [Pseudonocardiaceae bacterium]
MRVLLGRLSRGARVRAPWCELAMGVLWALLGLRLGSAVTPAWWLPVPLLLAAFAVPLVVVDLRHRRLPDALTLPAYPVLGVAVACAGVFGGDSWLIGRALAGAALFAGAHALVRLLVPASLGAGDVKLAGSLGGVLGAVGWPAVLVAAVLATVLTLALAVARIHRGEWRTGVPHGPGLLTAAWLVTAFPGTGLEVGHG